MNNLQKFENKLKSISGYSFFINRSPGSLKLSIIKSLVIEMMNRYPDHHLIAYDKNRVEFEHLRQFSNMTVCHDESSYLDALDRFDKKIVMSTESIDDIHTKSILDQTGENLIFIFIQLSNDTLSRCHLYKLFDNLLISRTQELNSMNLLNNTSASKLTLTQAIVRSRIFHDDGLTSEIQDIVEVEYRSYDYFLSYLSTRRNKDDDFRQLLIS